MLQLRHVRLWIAEVDRLQLALFMATAVDIVINLGHMLRAAEINLLEVRCYALLGNWEAISTL